MATTHLLALIDPRSERPFWGRDWVARVVDDYVPLARTGADRLLGWSVGSVVGSETLVQSRPIAHAGGDPVEDFLRAPAACTIASFATGGDDVFAPPAPPRTARYRRFITACAGLSIRDSYRPALLEGLPPFLARDAQSKSGVDLLLLRALSSLHAQGEFGNKLPSAEGLRKSLAQVQEILEGLLETGDARDPYAIFISDGRTVAVAHRGGNLLAFEPPADADRPQRFQVDGGSQPITPAAMLLWTCGDGPVEPCHGAERIAAGVVSTCIGNPGRIGRDPTK